MIDVREQIIVRLQEIADENKVAWGFKTVERNVAAIDDETTDMPALVVLDGDEQAIDEEPSNRPATYPQRIEMMPLIHLAVSAKRQEVGTDLNTLRLRVMRAVRSDAQLIALVDRNRIRYSGMEAPRTEQGRMVLSQRVMRFTITYILKSSDLEE